MKDRALLQGEIIAKQGKYIDNVWNSSIPELLGFFKPTWHKSFLGEGGANEVSVFF